MWPFRKKHKQSNILQPTHISISKAYEIKDEYGEWVRLEFNETDVMKDIPKEYMLYKEEIKEGDIVMLSPWTLLNCRKIWINEKLAWSNG